MNSVISDGSINQKGAFVKILTEDYTKNTLVNVEVGSIIRLKSDNSSFIARRNRVFMATRLGSIINGVILTYSSTSDADVSEVLLSAMQGILKSQITDSEGNVLYNLTSIFISSTSEPCSVHKEGGTHRSGRAVDISKINNKSVTSFYPIDNEVQAICDALQVNASTDERVVENFGPLGCFQPYNGKYILISGERNKDLISMHKTHLHFCVKA